jgi:hypothetical protein
MAAVLIGPTTKKTNKKQTYRKNPPIKTKEFLLMIYGGLLQHLSVQIDHLRVKNIPKITDK